MAIGLEIFQTHRTCGVWSQYCITITLCSA